MELYYEKPIQDLLDFENCDLSIKWELIGGSQPFGSTYGWDCLTTKPKYGNYSAYNELPVPMPAFRRAYIGLKDAYKIKINGIHSIDTVFSFWAYMTGVEGQECNGWLSVVFYDSGDNLLDQCIFLLRQSGDAWGQASFDYDYSIMNVWQNPQKTLGEMCTKKSITFSDVEYINIRLIQQGNQLYTGATPTLSIDHILLLQSGGYSNDGHFYTTDVLSNIANSIVLLTNTTIPENDIVTVEFSSDNVTWVDHNGDPGSDTLVSGNESLDLRDLSYSNLYSRFNLTDGGADSTPRLYQIRVITDEAVSGAEDRFILGLVIGIALLFCLFVYIQTRR